MNPLVTVIIPAYNNEDTLAAALDSIIAQTHKTLEIIVVDDFSTDGTRALAERYAVQDPRVRVIKGMDDPNRYDKRLKRNINAGWSARNAGLAIARGEYITFQDGDDVSLLNRIEVQLALIAKYGADHITTNCVRFDQSLVSTLHTGPLPEPAMQPEEIYQLSQSAKGLVAKLAPALNRAIPFYVKRMRVINKLFFGSLAIYPGAGNSPMFKRHIIEKVHFRPLKERVWPSFMGRGADRDFNFQVAETFKNSYYFDTPLYLWRT